MTTSRFFRGFNRSFSSRDFPRSVHIKHANPVLCMLFLNPKSLARVYYQIGHPGIVGSTESTENVVAPALKIVDINAELVPRLAGDEVHGIDRAGLWNQGALGRKAFRQGIHQNSLKHFSHE